MIAIRSNHADGAAILVEKDKIALNQLEFFCCEGINVLTRGVRASSRIRDGIFEKGKYSVTILLVISLGKEILKRVRIFLSYVRSNPFK